MAASAELVENAANAAMMFLSFDRISREFTGEETFISKMNVSNGSNWQQLCSQWQQKKAKKGKM